MNSILFVCEDEEGNELFHFDLPSNPFKIGEIFEYTVQNHDKEKWNVEDVEPTEYRVMGIYHSYSEIYRNSSNFIFITTVTLKKL